MSTAPSVSIDPAAFWRDPYPTLKELREKTPIAFVPELGATLFTRRDDIYVYEKMIEVFSSHQPQGLMNRLMGHNMMRKDGPAHQAERAMIFPSVSPRTVRMHWTNVFQGHANRIFDEVAPRGRADLFKDVALPISGECLMSLTGLTNITCQDMDSWSQGMIDGIANYLGDPAVEARCNAATSGIDAAIDDMVPVLRKAPDHSLLGVMLQTDMPMDSIRANVKLAISGGQNEPRDMIAGAVWALLAHPEQKRRALSGEVSWLQVFEEYARWMAPIGMSPRRVAQRHVIGDIVLEPEDRVFFMFGAANRDEAHFSDPDVFDVGRDTQKSIAFGAGPHYCAGAFASRAIVASVALPTIFSRLRDMRLDEEADPVRFGGWAFRGPLNLPARWSV
ncbi:MAG: cytochrome P450 [Rhodoblastus sp.]